MLLIDADNVSVDVMDQAVRLVLQQHGALHVRRAYCTAESAVKHQAVFKHLSIKPMVNLAAGKNSTDIALAVDAIDLVLAERPDVVVIASSDSDFAPLVQRLREKGCVVRGIGQSGKTGQETQDVYDDYTVLEHRKPSATRRGAATATAAHVGAGERTGARAAGRASGRAAQPAAVVPAGAAVADQSAEEPALALEPAQALAEPAAPATKPARKATRKPTRAAAATADAKSADKSAAKSPAAKTAKSKPAVAKKAATAKKTTSDTAKPVARRAATRKTAAAAATVSPVALPVATPQPIEIQAAEPAREPSRRQRPSHGAEPAPATSAPATPPAKQHAAAQGGPRGVSAQAVLACLPELAAGQGLALNVAVQRLREAHLLGKNTSSLKLFSQLADHFELLPARNPSQVRQRR